MNNYSPTHQPPYLPSWHTNNSPDPSSSSSSSSWTYMQDSVMATSASNYTQSTPEKTSGPSKSFRSTLLEIEDTFYKTFPAAAQARGWDVSPAGEDCSEEGDSLFQFSQSNAAASMTANSMGSDASESPNSGMLQQHAFSSSPSSSSHAVSDVLMGDSRIVSSATYQEPVMRQRHSSPHVPSPVGAPAQRYYQASPTHAHGSAVIPVSSSLFPTGSVQHAIAPPSYPPTSAINGSLSDACRPQVIFRDAQNRYPSPYVTSNLADGIPPMGTHPALAGGAHSSSESLTSPHPHPPLTPVSPAPASLLSQYPAQNVARALSVPPSPSHVSGYYPAPASSPSPQSASSRQTEPSYDSPDPSSPGSSITLYPVPQAPANHDILPPWPPQQISPETVPPARDPSVGRTTKRKRGKDSDKKPPLACLFCRGRKIACGPPAPDGDGKTCNQCHRRSLKCDYPAESRRGMRKEKTLPNLNSGGAKVVVKSTKKR